MTYKKLFSLFFSLTFFFFSSGEASLPTIDAQSVVKKSSEIMAAHASHHKLTPEIMERAFTNYLEILDPTKTYFIRDDIQKWVEPSPKFLEETIVQYESGDFSSFYSLQDKMVKAINRRRAIEAAMNPQGENGDVKADEFKDMDWVNSEAELRRRIERLKAFQYHTAAKLDEEFGEKSLERIAKHQRKLEEKVLKEDSEYRSQFVLSNVLKATASALDAHTAYFTPGEATQFMINVQQRLFGIGAQLRDDLNGFTVMKIIEGGPAELGKELKENDRIVAVDGEPVVGMDILSAVEMIRGKEGTVVTLTVIRESAKEEPSRLDIQIERGEVVLKESRYESSYQPLGDGAIGYLKLYSFYQDPSYSSSVDLAQEIEKLKKEHELKGLILDLRSNSGGMLSQAVGVTGLFITKGVVVGVKGSEGNVQYLRDLDGKQSWDGPLIVLVNKISASASEIVAQTLQDYGRAIIVGDETTFGKGSFQTFSLNGAVDGSVNPEGEYKVTRGRYYTVSGKTPQKEGVAADIVVPSVFSKAEIGEKFTKYVLDNETIKPNFDDDLSDVPLLQRQRIRALYKFGLQKKENLYDPYLETLRKNSAYRIENNKNYQVFLDALEKGEGEEEEEEKKGLFGQNDLQLEETYHIMTDLLMLMHQ